MKFFATSITSAAIAAALAGFAAPAFAANDNAQDYARGRIIVEPRAGLTADEFANILKVHGGKARKLGQSNLHIVDLPANASEKAVVALLKKHPSLKFAELDQRVPVTATTNDPYLGSEWHISKIGADTAWDTTQGAGVTIAILDSGVDAVPDLAANMVAGYNIYDNNTNTADVCGHGTKVAGAAAATSNNGAGVAGVAGQAKIMPVRIAYVDPTYGCYAYFSTIASGITWAADHGARIANVSYAALPTSSAIISASNYMKSKGGLVFVSAGNYAKDDGYTPTDSMIAVSATDSNDALASFSSFGAYVNLSAPGSGIYTTAQGGAYGAVNGTSFSAPIAAAVAALMMSANPTLSNSKVESLLYSTATDLGAAGKDPYFGYGRVNAAAAVAAAASSAPAPDTTAPTVAITSPSANGTVSGSVIVSVNAADNVGVARVDLKVNNTVVASDTAGPFSFSWNSTGAANGMNTLVAVAYDAAGNVASSTPVSVNVSNSVTPPVADTTAPALAITNPTNGGTVTGNVNITLSSSDNSGAAGISMSLYIDGALKASGSGASMSYSWNAKKATAGNHVIQAVAKDKAGNTTNTQVQVTSR
ncbi:S8 family serine peptidase [Pseudoduganella sp. RAF53_2]|uniref:S8 family serine peptidase n=1 Tax=unclassified Pseudoduganella TaxID=2637179 RepID=UPI003F9AF7FF